MALSREHLTGLELRRYRERLMPLAELLDTDDHVASCPPCHARVWTEDEAGEALESVEAALGTAHLTYEQMANLVDDRLTEAGSELFGDHLAYCSQCSQEVDDLVEEKSRIQARRGKIYAPAKRLEPAHSAAPVPKLVDLSRWTGFRRVVQVAAAAAVLVIMVWAATLRSRVADLESRLAQVEQANAELQKQAGSTAELEQALAEARKTNESLQQDLASSENIVASLSDGGRRVTLDRDGRIAGLDFLEASYQQDVKRALASQHFKLPAEVAALSGTSGKLMGGEKDWAPHGLLAPTGTAVRSDKPNFRWREVSGAATYVVTVYGDGFREAASSGPVSGTEWTPKQPLHRGRVYTWQVVTEIEGRQVVLPPAAAPRAKFRILDRTKLAELEQLERAHSNSHLALGVVYARLGLLEDSRHQFESLAAANPNTPVVQRLLHDITRLSPAHNDGN